MKGCSVDSEDDWTFTETATQVINECIFTKIAKMFWEKS